MQSKPTLIPQRMYAIDVFGKPVVLDNWDPASSAEKICQWVWRVVTTQKPLSKRINLFLPDNWYVTIIFSDGTGELFMVNISHNVILRFKDGSQYKCTDDVFAESIYKAIKE